MEITINLCLPQRAEQLPVHQKDECEFKNFLQQTAQQPPSSFPHGIFHSI